MKLIPIALLPLALFGQSAPTALIYDARHEPVRFAATEIRRAFAGRGETLVERASLTAGPESRRLVITVTGAAGAWQSYSIRRRTEGARTTWQVTAPDATGAMYGGLDLAEAVRLGSLESLGDTDRRPHIERRGIKFNAPLDLRTPSYSDNSTAAQANIPEMWSLDFWREFIDEMARHRFNVLSLWNLHPFPSIVKVPEYPEVALNDVLRSEVPFDDTYSMSGNDLVRPMLMERVEVVKKMTIEEKIAFWREVMRYAHSRGVEVYWITWNIFTFGAEGKYGITHEQDNAKTIAYFRASVRELVLTYPDLDGIGITAGEQMKEGAGNQAKEEWLWKTYGEGLMDAKQLAPERKVRLIHRFHMTGLDDIAAAFRNYSDPFDVSFKYSIAHMYSSTRPPFIAAALPHLGPQRRTWLTVRDDDIHSFRWADSTFAREYIRNMPGSDKVAGFYMGPDGYNWGREAMSLRPEAPRQLVMKKKWFSFLLWGRLSFDPALPEEQLDRIMAHRFPQVPVERLKQGWAAASRVFPEITKFFWGDIDLRWFPEACLSHPRFHKGFYTVQHFIEGGTMPASGILNIVEWRKRFLDGATMDGVTPSAVADALTAHAATGLAAARELRPHAGAHRELIE
ncbi:MAG TPA: carbohydrate-binding family 6 protein, partial [Solibacterales bacterium]|nr:carbohydrate-binding family 6 protein [Bryobacterales bacterium]